MTRFLSGDTLVANFEPVTTRITPWLIVSSRDQSTPDPTDWWWEFGNDAISTMQNPTHTHSLTGTFTVNLVISSPFGTDTLVTSNRILVTNLPPTYLPLIMKNH
jgi:PKD repeat protein